MFEAAIETVSKLVIGIGRPAREQGEATSPSAIAIFCGAFIKLALASAGHGVGRAEWRRGSDDESSLGNLASFANFARPPRLNCFEHHARSSLVIEKSSKSSFSS